MVVFALGFPSGGSDTGAKVGLVGSVGFSRVRFKFESSVGDISIVGCRAKSKIEVIGLLIASVAIFG